MDYECSCPEFGELFRSMRKSNADIAHFYINYARVQFDIIVDIGEAPFEIMIGAIRYTWACTLFMKSGYKISMNYGDYKALCDILNLTPGGEEHFTSIVFLRFIAEHVPTEYNGQIVDPVSLMPFRKTRIRKSDEPNKTVFKGWNDHIKDKREAHNFDKTELFFGKSVADYCRAHNISSMWTTPQNVALNVNAHLPKGFK